MIGVDISDRSIKIAEIDGGAVPRLKTVCWSPLLPNSIRRGVIQDVPVVTTALQQALTKCSPFPVASNEVVASIPEAQSFVKVIDLPQMPDSEVNEAIQWAVRQHIPFDLDRVYLDWQTVNAGNGQGERRQVLVGAVQRDVVDPLLQVIDNAGLRPVALELEAQAIIRSLLPPASEEIRGILILDLGATVTNVIFFDQGALRFTTSVQMGGDDLTQKLAQTLHLDPGVAAEKKMLVGLGQAQGENSGISLALRDALIELLQKVKATVQEMTAQMPEDAIRAILLSGGAANLSGIRDLIGEVFTGLPVQMGNPWTNISLDDRDQKAPLSPQDSNHFITALGLALRRENTL